MGRPLRISERSKKSLELIRDIEQNRLQRAVDLFDQVEKPLISEQDFLRSLQKVLDADTSKEILSQVIGLTSLSFRENMKLDSIWDDLNAGIKQDLDWDNAEEARWTENSRHLFRLLKSSSSACLGKSHYISRDHQYDFSGVRIANEIRPIFDEKSEHLLGCILTFMLRLDYLTIETAESISVALDYDDLKLLRDACDRALKEGMEMTNILDKRVRVPIYPCPED